MNLLSLSTFIPEQICDTQRFFSYEGNYRISHYCGYAADFISQILEDETIDGCVAPRSCDSTRVMNSYLKESGKFFYQIHVPPNSLATKYLASELRNYKKAVEDYFGIRLDDASERSTIINNRNALIAALYDDLADISYAAYLNCLHQMLQTPLAKQIIPTDLPHKEAIGPSVFLVGSTLPNAHITESIEAAGLRILGDRLPESKRLFSAPPVDLEGDIYVNIAESMLATAPSPTQDDFKAILDQDLAEIKAKNIGGVIFVTQTYCEPYDFLYKVYLDALNSLDIPILQIRLADSTDSRLSQAALETFAETLQG